MTTTFKIVASTALAAALFLPGASRGMQENAAAPVKNSEKGKSTADKKADATPPPSVQEIADARDRGLVWVNLNSRAYHKDGEFYGKTKRGKFMTEAEARKAGYHDAKPGSSAKRSKKGAGDQSGVDSTAATHSSTPAKP